MAKAPKWERIICYSAIHAVKYVKISWATAVRVYFLRRWGVNFNGRPNYISFLVDIDGTDYSLYSFGQAVTISSYVRILTHDWSPHTIGKAMGVELNPPLGRVMPVNIGDYTFVGTGSIVMPGTTIGRACIVGAGTVVRGDIPDYSIVVGSPAEIVGDSRDYMKQKFPDQQFTV